jgi:hypothetical protein
MIFGWSWRQTLTPSTKNKPSLDAWEYSEMPVVPDDVIVSGFTVEEAFKQIFERLDRIEALLLKEKSDDSTENR